MQDLLRRPLQIGDQFPEELDLADERGLGLGLLGIDGTEIVSEQFAQHSSGIGVRVHGEAIGVEGCDERFAVVHNAVRFVGRKASFRLADAHDPNAPLCDPIRILRAIQRAEFRRRGIGMLAEVADEIRGLLETQFEADLLHALIAMGQ